MSFYRRRIEAMKGIRAIQLALLCGIVYLTGAATLFAQEAEAASATSTNTGWFAIAAAFGIGFAAFGGALGQGKAISAALDGIARNPGATSKIQMPMLIGLAFIESLVIYVLLIAFFIVFKL
jgi:F-type H+-transporting ATPase subunit c